MQSFAEGVADELRDTGVTVTVFMPGPTDTRFFDRAGITDTKLGASDKRDDPADVAHQAFEALMAGKEKTLAGGLASRARRTRAPGPARCHSMPR
jgi:short-subunit dehydrogenase